jgi:hypothetical protein
MSVDGPIVITFNKKFDNQPTAKQGEIISFEKLTLDGFYHILPICEQNCNHGLSLNQT